MFKVNNFFLNLTKNWLEFKSGSNYFMFYRLLTEDGTEGDTLHLSYQYFKVFNTSFNVENSSICFTQNYTIKADKSESDK